MDFGVSSYKMAIGIDMQRSLGVLKLCCKFQVNIKKERKRGKEREEDGGKEGRKEGRNNSWSMFSMVRSLSFFFPLGIDAMDYSNQSEKSVGFIHILIPFG